YSYTDNVAPYALFGDDSKGNYYYGPGMKAGKYTLTVTAYSEAKGKGNVIEQKTVNFTLTTAAAAPTENTRPGKEGETSTGTPAPDAPEADRGSTQGTGIASLVFVNAQSDTDISPLIDGANLSMGKLKTHK